MKRYFSRIEKVISTNVEETESDGSKQEKATSAAVKETESDGSKQVSTFPPVNAQSSSVNQSREGPPSKSPSLSEEWKINGIPLEVDPGLRQKILIYHPNVQDEIRRAYLLKGPYQPREHSFKFREFGERRRRFNPSWFDQYTWLEYSIAEDAAYCLDCYLFAINKQSDQTKKDYRVRLEASVKCINWLLKHELPFRGHDESEDSPNRCLFLSLLEFYASDIEHVKSVVLGNAPKNLQMTSPDIQNDIVHALALETSKLITKDIGDDFFAILADEYRDVSVKEQMDVVLCYVDGKGCVLERFLGAIESMLVKHGLSISKVRGQGYDGASNIKGELNGLKTLILEESPSVYYIHYFAHRLGTVTNLVGASCKRQDIIRETQRNKDQDIVNDIHLVKVSKRRLQDMRDNGWEVLFQEAVEFCSEQSIEVPNINDVYVRRGKSKRINERVTCLHHFQAEVFYTVIDMQLQEINNRFDEVNYQFLLSMACLSPQDSFKAFDKDKLMQLATFYPNEFPPNAMKFLGHNLNSYICDLPFDDRFKNLKGVDELAKKNGGNK
ncbi:Zinc finger MYM-type protein 1 [Linum perenne]